MQKVTKAAIVLGAGGFIGAHLVKRLKRDGFWVRGVDLRHPEFAETEADDFLLGDLRNPSFVSDAFDRRFDETYQLAADMGGAGFIFAAENDADIMYNSAMINLNVLDAASRSDNKLIFYSSSACIYPTHNQEDAEHPNCAESSAYPAAPDSEYGWEKLFGERLYSSYGRCRGVQARVARYHNIFGPEGPWDGGREKAPAALCRKVAMAKNGDEIEVWGDGLQTRSFLYVDECVEGTVRLMRSGVSEPVNIGSEEMVTINGLLDMIADIAGKTVKRRHVDGPMGVRGRNSDNRLIKQALAWSPTRPLREGLERTYDWIERQVRSSAGSAAANAPSEASARATPAQSPLRKEWLRGSAKSSA